MKTDLATSIIAAIIGFAIAFFVTNIFIPEISPVSFKILSSSPNYSLTDPNPEIFNFRAINPTVEVYVGQCAEYDTDGSCKTTITSLDQSATESGEGSNTAENTNNAETEEGTNASSN